MNLYIFNHITEDPVISALLEFKGNPGDELYFFIAQKMIDFSDRRLTDKNIIREYILRTMLEKKAVADIDSHRDFLRHDVKTIYNQLFDVNWDELFRDAGFLPLCGITGRKKETVLKSYTISLESMINIDSNEALGGAILAHVEGFGVGKESAHPAFSWSGDTLVEIDDIDPVLFSDLDGTDQQIDAILSNTEDFLGGNFAKDMLLSGRANSSCYIKAILNMYKDRGLRVIELKSNQLSDISAVIGSIENKSLKYIIYIDDISEPDCQFLDKTLSGSLKMRPENVLIYSATGKYISTFLGINIQF